MENKGVYTNQVKFEIKKNYLLEDYDLIELSESGKDINYPNIWKLLKKEISIITYYKSFKKIYLLTQKNEIKKIDLKELVDLNMDIKLVDLQRVNRIKENILLNIFIGLFGTTGNLFSLGDFQNGCYLIHENKGRKLVTLKFFIDSNFLLNVNVTTFIKTTCTSKNVNRFMFYSIESNRLVRVLNPLEFNTEVYIKKNSGKKSNINFMHFEKEFLKSKVGYIATFIENINLRLSRYLSIDLVEKEFSVFLDGKNKLEKINEIKESINRGFSNYKKLHILDYEERLDSEYRENLKEKITSIIGKKISINFIQSLDKETPTFVFLFNKNDYKEKDPYEGIKNANVLTQVITYDIHKKLLDKNILIEALLKELLIKIEIVNHDYYLTSKLEEYIEYSFFIRIIVDKKVLYKKVFINDNNISSSELTLFDNLKIEKVKDLVKDESNIELIAFYGNDYFVICKTKEFIIPDFHNCLEIYKQFDSNNEIPRLRWKKFREYTLAGLSGINFIRNENSLVYYSSVNSLNPNVSIAKSNLLRMVYFNHENFDHSKFLNTLDEYYIRNKEFTVLPFIYKYLKEYLNMKIFP